ncbi:MAG TPA: ABC transporter substrate-binding protein, partial [Anaerolineae bacterium]|nr:ABC transporter substrate-binding protein [Anaerolineae bacterium]
WEKEANGSGPFKLDRWRDDEIIVLSKNSDYYKPSGNVAQIIYKLDSGLPLAEFEQGEIDIVGIGESAIERVRDPDDPLTGTIFTEPSLCTTFIGLNNALPPFDDVRVRQAFNYALDKQRLVNGLYAGSALAASGVLPPGMPGAMAHDVYPYDPDRARALLREANFDTSQPLVFTAAGYSDVSATPTAVISLWEEVLRVQIEVQLIEPFLYSAEIYAGNTGNFFSYGWCADYLDPENFLSILFSSDSAQNWGRYNNPTVDSLLITASSEADVNKRMALYAEIEAQIVADAPYTFLAHSVSSILVNPRIENYAFTPIGIPQWQRVTLNDN